jgi:hypothetical protein
MGNKEDEGRVCWAPPLLLTRQSEDLHPWNRSARGDRKTWPTLERLFRVEGFDDVDAGGAGGGDGGGDDGGR